ncbi:MAG: acetoin utilization protein AcuC [Chloroflexi bacterium]|nr:acetoin utilization protein AcuC [Chloroflexota bacterium]MCI0849039.1 acetoin utilization protein AcuC [Chloroflexota bacterium]MCI0864683.1 acetoin utilization protein AcuC [Chloroflexota bacterium]MCI0899517.1 acetoin utilization protein AcuC [Chloroflexota bacterium]
MRRAAFIYEDALSRHELRSDHPMRPVRLRYTYELLQEYGAFDHPEAVLLDPRSATEEELAWLHTSEYIAAVKALGSGPGAGSGAVDPARFGFSGQGDNPVYPNMFEAAALSTGGSLLAAEMVASGEVSAAFNISGGLHHAAAGHASGFCVFNDPALAVHYFLNRGMRVAYVDIDAHHGDGVQEAFYSDDRVLTISVHESGQYLFPGTGSVDEMGEGAGRGYSVNLPLYPYTGDDDYVEAFSQVVPPLVRAFAPDVLVTQLGIDSYHSDPLTHLQVTTEGYIEAVRQLAGLGLPWLALGGGGYDVTAVARAWTLAFGVMLDIDWPDQLPSAFAKEHGSGRLRDELSLEVPAHIKVDVRRYIEDSVGAIRQQIFPLHGLTG